MIGFSTGRSLRDLSARADALSDQVAALSTRLAEAEAAGAVAVERAEAGDRRYEALLERLAAATDRVEAQRQEAADHRRRWQEERDALLGQLSAVRDEAGRREQQLDGWRREVDARVNQLQADLARAEMQRASELQQLQRTDEALAQRLFLFGRSGPMPGRDDSAEPHEHNDQPSA